MAVRTTMAALIARIRILINDPSGTSQVFDDQTIQDVLDEARFDCYNQPLRPMPTYSGSTILFLDYFADLGNWEDGMTLKQFLTVDVTANATTIEPIAGHFQFNQTTLPPVMVTGKRYDLYRASADLLERWIALVALRFDITANGQTLRRSQMAVNLQKLADSFRRKQQPRTMTLIRTDLQPSDTSMAAASLGTFGPGDMSLGATEIDYLSAGR